MGCGGEFKDPACGIWVVASSPSDEPAFEPGLVSSYVLNQCVRKGVRRKCDFPNRSSAANSTHTDEHKRDSQPYGFKHAR